MADPPPEVADLASLASRLHPSPALDPNDPLVRSLELVTDGDVFLGDGNLLQLMRSTTEEVVEKVSTFVDLTFLGKWVRSATSGLANAQGAALDPATEDPVGGMPIADRIVAPKLDAAGAPIAGQSELIKDLPPNTLMHSDTPEAQTTPGVPEVLGRVKGTVEQAVVVTKRVTRTDEVRVEVEWRAYETGADGIERETDRLHFSTDDGTTFNPLPPGGTKLGPAASLDALQIKVRLPVLFTELTTATPDVVTIVLRVRAQLSVGGVTTPWTSLDPPVALPVPAIPLPTVVVLCEHRDFQGHKAVIAPTGSPLVATADVGGVSVGTALGLTSAATEPLRAVLGAASSAVRFVDFLAAAGFTPGASAAQRAAAVLTGLGPSADTKFVANSNLVDLDIPELEFRGGLFRLTASLMADSLIVVGRPGTTVVFGQKTHGSRALISPLIITLPANQVACAIRRLEPLDGQRDPSHSIVFGGDVAAHSPRQSNDQIHAVAISRPAAGPTPAQ